LDGLTQTDHGLSMLSPAQSRPTGRPRSLLAGKGNALHGSGHAYRCKKHDLLSDNVYRRIHSDAEAGRYSFGCFGVPCSTFSIVRLVEVEGSTGATVVRDLDNIKGLPNIPPPLQRQVDRSNELVRRAMTIARAITANGGDICFENPCDRGGYDDDDSVVRSMYQEAWRMHAPLWRLPIMRDMKLETRFESPCCRIPTVRPRRPIPEIYHTLVLGPAGPRTRLPERLHLHT
jgi:hypothetical protein